MLRTGLALVAFASVSAALPSVSAAQDRPDVAVLGIQVVLDSPGEDKRAAALGKVLTRSLRAQAADGDGPYALAPNAERDLLEIKLLSGCGSEARGCMSQIGRDLGADRLLYGKLSRKGKSYQISLMLLDVTSERMERTVTERVPVKKASKEQMRELAANLYGQLVGSPAVGALVVRANVDSGTVFVDGQAQTSLAGGLAKIPGLTEGTHTITVEADGYAPFDREVTVAAGEETALEAFLAPVDGPVEEDMNGYKIAFWSSLVVTGAAGVGFTVYGLKVQNANEKLDAMGNCPTQDICDEGNRASTLSWVFGGATVAAGLATTYFLYKAFLDEDGIEEAPAGGQREPVVRMAPVVGPDYVGGGFAIEF